MTSRLSRIIKVRRIASRAASDMFVEATERAARCDNLVERLADAAHMLGAEESESAGGALAAQNELSGRMRAAGALARHSAALASADQQDAAFARMTARRALELAVEMTRANDRAAERRRDATRLCFVKARS